MPHQSSEQVEPVPDVSSVESAENGMPDHGVETRRDRIVRRVAMAVMVAPIFVAAIRNGIQGWYPSFDAATVIIRARDVFGANPPLVGMWASVSSDLGRATFFPGAIQLYLLAVPVRLLGNTWGPLLGMSVINAGALLVAGWLAKRRLGPRVVTVAYLAMAMLVWTMGSEVLVDVAPMQMVTIPFVLFLVAVWSAADGDLVAIPILAVAASYLVLDHLVLTFLVPAIGLCALVGLVFVLRQSRRDHPETWAKVRGRGLRMLGIGLGATLVLWIPSLIQQFTNSPGNLTNLWNAGKITGTNHITPLQSLDAVVSIIVKPPFWLGDSFQNPSFGHFGIGILGTILGALFAVLMVGLVVLAARKRDRTSVTVLVVSIVTLVASIYNITRAPSPYGFRVQYLHSLWVVAMFTWLAVAVALIRNVPVLTSPTAARRVASVGAAATLIVATLALPHKDPGRSTNGTTDISLVLTKQVLGPSVDALRGKGQVEVIATGTFSNFVIASALMLALQTEGIDFCVPAALVDQYAPHRACNRGGADVVVLVKSAVYPADPTETVIAEGSALTSAVRQELSVLNRKVVNWLATQDTITVTPAAKAFLVAQYGATDAKKAMTAVIEQGDWPVKYLALSPAFAHFISASAETRPDGTVVAPIKAGDFPQAELVRWADLVDRANNGYTARIAIQHPPS